MIKVTSRPVLNAKLSDICIGTSAAPTLLPAHYFENNDQQGEPKEFNLIDGGVAANNPVMLLITHEFFLIDFRVQYTIYSKSYGKC